MTVRILRSLSLAPLALALAVPALAQQNGAAPPKARQQVEAFMQKWKDAYNSGDGDTLAKLIDPASFGVSDRGTISGNDRVERAMQNEAKLGGKVTELSVEQVRSLGRGAVVATGPYAVTYSNPRPLTIQGTWMQVLHHEKGGWKSVAASYTPLTRPQAAEGATTPPSSAASTTR